MIPFLFKKTTSDDLDVVKGYKLTYCYPMRVSGLYPDIKGFRYYLFGIHLNFIHVAYLWYVFAYILSTYYGFVYNDIKLVSYELCYGLLTIIFFLVAHTVLYRRNHLESLFRAIGEGLFTYEIPMGQEERDIMNDCDKRCRETSRRNMLIALMLTLSSCIIPSMPPGLKGDYSTMVEGGIPVNKNLPLPIWCPFATDNGPAYWMMCIFEIVAGNAESLIVGANCTLFCNLCTILSRELKLLCLALRNTRSRAIYLFKTREFSLPPNAVCYEQSELFQQCMTHCIDECIKHHIALSRFHAAIQDFVEFPIFAIFSGTALTISAPMFMLLTTTGDTFTVQTLTKMFQYGYAIFCFTFFLGAYCVFGQMLTHESSLVHFAFYETPWTDADSNFKRSVIMGMIHSKKPFVLTAFGIFSASAETLVDILKAIFSYFNLLAATQ